MISVSRSSAPSAELMVGRDEKDARRGRNSPTARRGRNSPAVSTDGSESAQGGSDKILRECPSKP